MNKKGQAWGVDLMVGVIIFTIGVFIFFIYSINYSPYSDEKFEKIYSEAEMISENIMSEGSPTSWNFSSVMRIGLLTENKLDQEKIDRFYNLSIEDYNLTKRLLNAKNDYFIKIENLTANGENVEGIGKEMNSSDLETNNLVKISRAGIYQNKPVSVFIYVWD